MKLPRDFEYVVELRDRRLLTPGYPRAAPATDHRAHLSSPLTVMALAKQLAEAVNR